MNKTLAFVKLDYLTVKPYFKLKSLAVILAAPLFILISTEIGAMSIGAFVIFAALYISYPFVIGEKNNMDALYATLSIPRRTTVVGRYLFALSFDLCAALLGLALTSAALFFMGRQVAVAELLLTTLAMLVVVSLIEAVQLPIYFKLGYEKAKLLAYLPFILFWLAALAMDKLLPAGGLPEEIGGFLSWLLANPPVAVLLGFAVWLGLMLLSCQTSLAFYRKRDF